MADAPAVHLLTLGCPKNEVDSRGMADGLRAAGYRLVDDLDAADAVIVNTCAFIQAATEESIATVLELAASWRPAVPDRHIIVAGCMPSRYGAELADALTEADAFVPVAAEGSIVAELDRLLGGRRGPARSRSTFASAPYAYLMISDGCHRACAYCTIPSIRGPYRSRPLPDIAAEARALVAAGARELILIGQDTSAYGIDLPGEVTLADVLDEIASTSGAARVRVLYVQPDGVTDRLLAVMAAHENVCRYLDIPLQHASAAVLRRMRRTGDAASLIALLDRVRRTLPGVTLRTTFIAGFPGETEADVETLERFVRDASFDYAGVFVFSPEDGTPAASMPDQVSEAERITRAERIREVADEVGAGRAATRVGTVERVLVDPPDEDGEVVGRTCGQAPDIDGVVHLDDAPAPGTLIDVRIIDSIGYDLVGELS